MNEQEDLFKCIICFETFTSDRSDPNGVMPVDSGVCSHPHKQCKACLENRFAAMMEDSAHRQRKWLDCSICNKKKAFNVEEPIISVYTMHLMKWRQKQQRQQQHQVDSRRSQQQQRIESQSPITAQKKMAPHEFKTVSLHELEKKFNAAQKHESQFSRSFDDPHPVSVVTTHPNYRKFARRYLRQVRKRQNSEKSGAVVLDLFGGIGSGLIALKRQSIAVKKYIHVDHDEVASLVCTSNHTNDGIDHIRIEKFQELVNNLNDIMNQHAPIDIVLASPPCIDFTPVNASRDGVRGEQGRLMIC